jgi:opacity protein-like surface antigen
MRRLIALAAAASLIAGAAQAADQFDLVCVGVNKSLRLGAPVVESHWTAHYSIDLAKQSYCDVGCATAQRIQSIDAGKLVLEDQTKDDPVLGHSEEQNIISRATGQVQGKYVLGLAADFWSGTCVAAPFTPLPKALF